MASQNLGSSSSSTEFNDEIRTCWICFSTDEDNPTMPWVQPCSCRGSGQWVHQTCLLLWVDEKKKDNRTAKISCPQCKGEYLIMFPKGDMLMSFVQVIDDFVYKACPVIAAGVTVGIIFWAASSYGAFTIMQIFGEDEGLKMLERTDPLALLVFLPIIPTALIMMKLVRWEDYVLKLLRKGSKYPVLKHILPSIIRNEIMGELINIEPQPTDVSSTRIFVGGLVLPTIAKIFGDVFFHSEQSCLKKCIFGGLAFIAIKGVLQMYYKQKTYIQQSKRRVLNHYEIRSTLTSVEIPTNDPNSITNINIDPQHLPSSVPISSQGSSTQHNPKTTLQHPSAGRTDNSHNSESSC